MRPLSERSLATVKSQARNSERSRSTSGVAQRAEDAVVAPAALAPVAQRGERGRRRDARPVGPAQVAQDDDVAPALAQVLRRVDLQQPVGVGLRVRVELDPDELALARAGVEDQHRRAPRAVARQVAQADGVRALQGRGRVQAGDLRQDHRAGREAVERVERRGVDRHAGAVARHLAGLQVDAAPGVRVAVGAREGVVGERQQAGGVVETVTAGAGRVGRGGARTGRGDGEHGDRQRERTGQSAHGSRTYRK